MFYILKKVFYNCILERSVQIPSNVATLGTNKQIENIKKKKRKKKEVDLLLYHLINIGRPFIVSF